MNYKGSIKKRLISIILLVTTLTGIIGYGGFVSWYMQNQYDRALNLSKTVSLILGQDFAKLILLNEVSAAADITSQLKSFPNLNSMVVYKLDKKPVFQYSKENKSFEAKALSNTKIKAQIKNRNLKLYIDANYQEHHLGFVQFNFQVETIYDIIKKDLGVLIVIFLLMLILSYLLAEYFAKKFTNPILTLVSFLEKIEESESLSNKIHSNEDNEYGKLYNEVNTMLERIESSHKALKIAAVAFETQSGIIITDKTHNILQVNNSFTRITGYKKEEILGKTPAFLKSGLQNDDFYIDMFKKLKERNFWMGEIKNCHKNGNIVSENLTIQSVLDNNNETIYYVASFIDLTQQKETENQLKEKENMLVHQSKMASMGEMLGNIAHQWRQPLSIISTISTGIQLKKDLNLSQIEDEDIKQLKKIDSTVYYLSETIEDFRNFFKPDKEKESFNLGNSWKKTINLLESKFKTISIEIIENIDNSLELYTLQNELMQVFMNILNNAKDALESKNKSRKLIFIDIYKENSNAIILIKDNAGGIKESIKSKIFEPYFTTKHQSIGTGIGLYMSLEMVTKHMNGLIEVQNTTYLYEKEEFKGACFKLTLPLKNSI